MAVVTKVWSLWPSIREMADDLGESVMTLIDARSEGRLPNKRHDEIIVKRAIHEGVRLTKIDLQTERQKPPLKVRREEGKELIARFYEACGGEAELSEQVGCTKNYLAIAKCRGYLPRARKYEFMMAAEQAGFTLPGHAFDPIK